MSKYTTDTSADAVESFAVLLDEDAEAVCNMPPEMTGLIANDSNEIAATLRALAAERDALRLSLAEARNAALDEAAAPFLEEAGHDESGLLYSSLVGIPISNAAELQKSADRAQSNADRILALKTPPTGDTE